MKSSIQQAAAILKPPPKNSKDTTRKAIAFQNKCNRCHPTNFKELRKFNNGEGGGRRRNGGRRRRSLSNSNFTNFMQEYFGAKANGYLFLEIYATIVFICKIAFKRQFHLDIEHIKFFIMIINEKANVWR